MSFLEKLFDLASGVSVEEHVKPLLTREHQDDLRSRMIWNSYRGYDAEPLAGTLVRTYEQDGLSDEWVDNVVWLFRSSPEYGLKTVLEAKSHIALKAGDADEYLEALHRVMEKSLLGFIEEHEYLDNRNRLANALRHYFSTTHIGQRAAEIYRGTMPVDNLSSFSPVSRKPF